MSPEAVERYPLSWPVGWKRTPYSQRRNAAFHSTRTYRREDGQHWKAKESLTLGDAIERLTGELRRLGARNVVISSNLRVRQDGLPYSQQAKQLDDPGVAVYFRLSNAPRVLACDKWRSAAENIAAIAGHIDAIRKQDRYGVGTLEQAFAGYAAIPAKTGGEDWRAEMGFKPDEHPDSEAIEARFRALARERHPDAGGSHEAMARLNQARASAMQEQLVGAR